MVGIPAGASEIIELFQSYVDSNINVDTLTPADNADFKARRIVSAYKMCRDNELEENGWLCSLKIADVVMKNDTRTFGGYSVYQLPTDYLKIHSINDIKINSVYVRKGLQNRYQFSASNAVIDYKIMSGDLHVKGFGGGQTIELGYYARIDNGFNGYVKELIALRMCQMLSSQVGNSDITPMQWGQAYSSRKVDAINSEQANKSPLQRSSMKEV